MRLLLTTLRRSPAALVGTLVALTMAAAMLTTIIDLAGSANAAHRPVHRLAGVPVVVVGDPDVTMQFGHGDAKYSQRYTLTSFRGVPAREAARLRTTSGVGRVVADVSAPVSLLPETGGNGDAAPATVHGWSSAALTPYRLTSGRTPTRADEVVLDAALARRAHARVGTRLRLAGRDEPPLRVVGLTRAPGSGVAPDAAFVTEATAARLAARPGVVDLLGVYPAPGTSVAGLRTRVAATMGSGFDVLTGTARGRAEQLEHAGDKDEMTGFAGGAGTPVIIVALFVVAGATGLSVAGRRRHFALLRAVGATPGQIRRVVAGELTVLGVLGGVLGWPLGVLISRTVVWGMVGHGLLPPGTTAWSAWWVLLASCGAGVVVALVSGFVASRRAGRVAPSIALGEAVVDRRRPPVLRLVLGVAALGGGVTTAVFAGRAVHNPNDVLLFAQLTLLAFVAAIGFLGPLLIGAAELVLRVPLRMFRGPAAHLALADSRRRARRIASSAVAVALSVGFLGTVYLVNRTALHADDTQSRSRLAADQVLTAPGGLLPDAVASVAATPGVRSAVGVSATGVYTSLNGGDEPGAAVVTPGRIADVLRLQVVSGRLDGLRSGDVALSRLEAGDTKVGSSIRVYLADGTPYRARVAAIYGRSMGFGDVLLPAGAAGGQHPGSDRVEQVLVRGRIPGADLARLAERYPGLAVHTSAATNAHARKLDEQSLYLNNVIVVLMALLATVTLINTLATATVERRDSIRLLDRIGATRRQALRTAGAQAVLVAGVGLLAGAAAGGSALVQVSHVLTGSWRPYLPGGTIALLVTGVVVLSAAAILVPTALTLRARRVE